MKIQRKILIQVPPGQKKLRIDKYLASHIENSSRTKIKKAAENGLILVNSRAVKPNYQVLPNDKIDISLPDAPERPDILPEDIPLDIIYEDPYILVVNKQPGMVTHPAYLNSSGTLVNALLYYVGKNSTELSRINGADRAGIVHRLDKNTSGLLIVAKDELVHRKLSRLFFRHDIDREYWAVVWGIFRVKKGVIEKALARSDRDRKKVVVKAGGKSAVTEYEVLKEFDFLSLVKLRLRTGRTHQIRVHMHSIGHPVFGDPDYEGRKPHGVKLTGKVREKIERSLELMPRQALHAKVLGFVHPASSEYMRFENELPGDMKQLIDFLESEQNG